MATNAVQLTPDVVNQLSQILIDSFGKVSEGMAKEISQKAIAVANKKTEKTINDAARKGTFLDPVKKFLEKSEKTFKDSGVIGLTKNLISQFKQAKQTPSLDKTPLLPDTLKELVSKQPKKELDLIKDEEKPQKVLIDGITEVGFRDLSEKLPEILKGLLDKKEKESTEEKIKSGGGLLGLLPPGLLGLLKGALLGGGGIALLLGGLAALITGLETEGPWKGTLKILSKLGLSGGLAMLKKGATKFIENFKLVTDKIGESFNKVKKFFAPLTEKIGKLFKPLTDSITNIFSFVKDKVGQIFNGLKDKAIGFFKPIQTKIVSVFTGLSDNLLKFVSGIGKTITGFFGKAATGGGALGSVTKVLSGAKGIFGKMLGGIINFLKPIAKRIPVLGTVIGLGFAYTRFKSGDTVGGIIDVLSAIATLVPFAGTAISIGLDVLNAFLDHKAGGADGEASKKKSGMIGDFFGGIWDWIKDKVTGLFSWFTDLGGKLISGQWGDAFKQIAGWIPGLDWVLGFLGTDVESLVKAGNTQGEQNVDMIGNLMTWMKESIWDKVTGFADSLVGGVKDWWSGVVNWWDGEDTKEAPPAPKTSGRSRAQQTDDTPGLATGGIVKKPIKSWVGEAGPEAVIPLDKYMSPEGFKISNDLLGTIASNTSTTNDNIKILGQAILKLASAFNNKQTPTPQNNIIMAGENQQQYPTAAQLASSNVDPIRQIRMQFAV